MKLSIKKVFQGLLLIAVMSLLILSAVALYFNAQLAKNQNYLVKASTIKTARSYMSNALVNFFARQENILVARKVTDITAIPSNIKFSTKFMQGVTLLSNIENQPIAMVQALNSLEERYPQFLADDTKLYTLSENLLRKKDELTKLTAVINNELAAMRTISDDISGTLVYQEKLKDNQVDAYLLPGNLLNSTANKLKFRDALKELLNSRFIEALLVSDQLNINFAILADLIHQASIEENSDMLMNIRDNEIVQLLQSTQDELIRLIITTKNIPDIQKKVTDIQSQFNMVLLKLIKAPQNIFSLRQTLNDEEVILQKTIISIQKNKNNIVKEFDKLSSTAESLQNNLINKAQQIKIYSRVALAVFAITIILIMGAIGFFLLKAITNSLNSLVSVMRKVSEEEGNLNYRLEQTPYEDLNKVSSAFNTMTGKLQYIHGHLQELVDSKTQELREFGKNLAVRHSVTAVLVEHLSLYEAISKVIEIMCSTMLLEAGAFWEMDNARNELRCMFTWSVDVAEIKEFSVASKQKTFARGIGLPGRVLETKKLHWIPDICHDANFSRAIQAKKAGLNTGVAFPILFNEDVVGVIEFFIRTEKVIDEAMVRTFDDIGKQINIFIEREETQKKFDSLSRRAGMADVATSILHNLGNILNSVNVTTNLLKEKFYNNSNLKNLAAAINLLNENLDNLPHYLSENPKGKLIPTYLISLAKTLNEEQAEVKNEITSLVEHLKHIEDIVAMQKTISGVSGISERVFLPEIVNAAIQMCNTSLEKRSIDIQKEFKDSEFITTDKSKLLQILVNLMQNARDALSMSEYDIPNKKILVTIEKSSEELPVKITITDNGSGIRPENLTKIFALGFTTKPDGHGFGLHSSATAAKELGGSLNVNSAGPGQGATFTLLLPLFSEASSKRRSTDVQTN